MGMRQDFGCGEAPAEEAPAQAAAPGCTAELEKLASLGDEGVITDADFKAKKKRLLGI
jgi:Short C-terminal domain